MPILQASKYLQSQLSHQIFSGTTWHNRLLPAKHKFAYPYRYWGVNISALAAGQALPEVGIQFGLPFAQKKSWRVPLFSSSQRALQRFCADDYMTGQDVIEKDKQNDSDNPAQALAARLEQAFIQQTGSAPTGEMIGMLVCRNAGLYFSPVNFYIGFNQSQTPTHLLAEVSNTPWNKRHYYGFLLEGDTSTFCHDKDFHVSPFNPIDQQYCWQVDIDKQTDATLQVRISIDISDGRGEVLKTGIKMSGVPISDASIKDSLQKNPLMNISSLTRIYAHAFKLYAIKKVPYINYDESLVDSAQDKS